MYRRDLDLLRETRAETLRLVEGVGQAQSEFSPGPEKWSAGETLDHLLLSEAHFREIFARLIELQKAGQRAMVEESMKDLDTSIVFLPKAALAMAELPLMMMNLFIPTAVREAVTQFRIFRTKNPAIAEPRRGKAIDGLRQELRESYERTAALFHANPALDYRAMRYRHPLMGANNALQLLRVLARHEQRHQQQIKEALAAARYPNAA
jgi:uncharacterized damage-inducible protein DinB